ncbi:MAG: hypothetical protein ACI9SY_000152 [Candidatus Paceibacteria bacterium]
MGVPLNFVVHTHIVTEHAGVQNRYDVFAPFTLQHTSTVKTYSGLIFKNLLPPDMGFLLWFRIKMWWRQDAVHKRWGTKIASQTTGTYGSSVHKLFQLIEDGHLVSYPYKETGHYNMIAGPNSNTFVQWVADLVPECNLSLPWNAWGKGYKKK